MRVAQGFPLTRLSHDDILTRHEFLRHERGGGLNPQLTLRESFSSDMTVELVQLRADAIAA